MRCIDRQILMTCTLDDWLTDKQWYCSVDQLSLKKVNMSHCLLVSDDAMRHSFIHRQTVTMTINDTCQWRRHQLREGRGADIILVASIHRDHITTIWWEGCHRLPRTIVTSAATSWLEDVVRYYWRRSRTWLISATTDRPVLLRSSQPHVVTLSHSFWRFIQTFTPLLLHYTPADLAWIRKAIVQCDPEQWGHSTDWWSVHTENWSSYSSAKMDNTIAWMRHVINTYQSVQLSILTVAMDSDEP